jgi:hypothetical protein
MDYTLYLPIVAKILQVVGLILSSSAILGENRLRKLETISRKFRKTIKIRLLFRKTRTFVGVLVLVLFILYIVVYPFFIFKNVVLPDTGKCAFVLFLMFSYLLSALFYLGAIYLIGNMLIKSESITKFFYNIGEKFKNDWLVKDSRRKQSVYYKILYYSLFPVIVILVLIPLKTINEVSKQRSLKGLFKTIWLNHEHYFLPNHFKEQNIPRIDLIKQSLSRNNYIIKFTDKGVNLFVPVVIVLNGWLIYYLGEIISVITTIYLGLLFLFLYSGLWIFVTVFSTFLGLLTYLFMFPYKLFEILRIRTKLRSSLLTAGFVLGLIGILLD